MPKIKKISNLFQSRIFIKRVIEFSSFHATDSDRFIENFLLNMRLSFIHNLNRGNITPRLYFRASWKKITNPSHDPFSSTDPSAFPFSIHFFSSSRLPTLYSPDTRPRAWQRRFKRISTVLLPVLTLEYFLSLKKTKKGRGKGGNKREETSLLSARQQKWGNKEYREMRFVFEIINFDLCSVSGFTNEPDL